LSDQFIFFTFIACKDRWKHIRTVFVCHLHDKTPSGLSATEKHPYYLHEAVRFMTSHITKTRHQESNLAVPHIEEDTAFTGESEEDTQMNEAPNEYMPESITPLESSTIAQQASCCQSNRDDCKQWLLGR
jgi:hypothetical protein